MNEEDRVKELNSKVLTAKDWIIRTENAAYFPDQAWYNIFHFLGFYLLGLGILVTAIEGIHYFILIFLAYLIGLLIINAVTYSAKRKARRQPLYIRAKQIMQAWEDYKVLVDKVYIWKKAVEFGECPHDPEYATSCHSQLIAAEIDLLAACDIFLKYAELDKLERAFRKTNPNSAFVGEVDLAQSLAQLRLPLATAKYRVTEADVRAEQAKLLAELAQSPGAEEVELIEKIDELKVH